MLRLRYVFMPFMAGGLLAGCSGSNAAGGGGAGGEYRQNLGTADRTTLIEDTREALLTRYGFRLEREVTSSEDVRYETEWKEESALDDERAAGYTHARTRILVTARPRNRSTSLAQSYAVRFEATNEVREFGSDVWQEAPMTPMRLDYIKQIATFLKTEYSTALR
jgi:hypothetical protein